MENQIETTIGFRVKGGFGVWGVGFSVRGVGFRGEFRVKG